MNPSIASEYTYIESSFFINIGDYNRLQHDKGFPNGKDALTHIILCHMVEFQHKHTSGRKYIRHILQTSTVVFTILLSVKRANIHFSTGGDPSSILFIFQVTRPC